MLDRPTTRKLLRKITYARVLGSVGEDWALRLVRRMDHRINKAKLDTIVNTHADKHIPASGDPFGRGRDRRDQKKTLKQQVVDKTRVKA